MVDKTNKSNIGGNVSCNLSSDSLTNIEVKGRYLYFLSWLTSSRLSGTYASLLKWKTGMSACLSRTLKEDPTWEPIHKVTIPPPDVSAVSQDIATLKQNSVNWPYATISDYHSAYQEKRTTPLQIITKLLSIMESPEIVRMSAILEIHCEEILTKAEESTKRYESNQEISLLDGVPFFIKEEIEVDGYDIKLGSTHYLFKSKCTATAIQRLLDKGAILCGTTTMTQFGTNPIGFNPSRVRNACYNPWNDKHYCGGSSSGCGAVVAAGLCPFSIGVDGLGSVRIPAGMTGLVGLKPTYPRIPRKGICSGETSTMAQIGSINCCVRDAAIVYAVMAGVGSDPEPGIPPVVLPTLQTIDIKQVKWGYCSPYTALGNDTVVTVFHNVLKEIELLGGVIIDVSIPELKESLSCSSVYLASGLYSHITSVGAEDAVKASEDAWAKTVMAVGSQITSSDVEVASRQRTRLMLGMESLFKEVDVLLLLNTGCTASISKSDDQNHGIFDEKLNWLHIIYSFVANFAGLPAICVNVGYEESTGLPISLQLVCKWWNEDVLLNIANQLESMFPHTRSPSTFKCPLKEIS